MISKVDPSIRGFYGIPCKVSMATRFLWYSLQGFYGIPYKVSMARQVPYALRPKVEAELERLEKEGILSKVEYSEWATPIVVKRNGSVRICGDFKVTVNPVLLAEQYPLPRIEDIFANLAGGQHFSKIDLRQAYHQMEVTEESKKYLTINTHKGLFQYNRLVFGVTSSPAIWQRAMDQVLQGIPGVQCILDDMIITGRSDEEHLGNLEEVLKRLEGAGSQSQPSEVLACDASPTGIGAVLSHIMPDGGERPVAFASRSLTKTERKYAQIDKEALSIVWGVKKFHIYLFGRRFTLITDHQPLTSIFHPEKGVPTMTAARLQRYALFLAGFEYEIEYKKTWQCSRTVTPSLTTKGEG
ncbi:hypothetical protein QZH41_000190 [Actinostola sp. cb2023]|nr:hypothetical protein QZH41_000190 [Actinostola sp. cb2023]